jgi:glutaredoxin
MPFRPSVGRCLDVVLTVCCVTIAALMLEQRFRISPAQATPSPSSVGQKIDSLPEINFADASQTVVIFTRAGCPYCEQSAAFWQRLIQKREETGSKRVRIVAVSDDSVDVTRDFMIRHDVKVDRIVFARLPIRGTPTILLVDPAGVVRASWLGRPANQDAEEQIIRQVL